MNAEQMATKILDAVKRYDDGVTFITILKECGPEAEGWLALCFKNRPNLVLWNGVSQLFADAYALARPKMEMLPVSYMVYVLDGEGLNLPIATNAEAEKVLKYDRDFKKPTWLPVAFAALDASAVEAI
jgi:hypothetical protein